MNRLLLCLLVILSQLPFAGSSWANPWNGKTVLQGFWWGCETSRYPNDWYTYLAKLTPRLRDMGFDGIWAPSPAKAWQGTADMGYGIYDHYDLGDKFQKDTLGVRFGDKDAFLRLAAVVHANGMDFYPEVVVNHVIGGEEDPGATGADKFKRFRYVGFSGPESGRWPKDHWNFHPNPDHGCTEGDICGVLVGQDICYLDAAHGGGSNGQYMLDQARDWFVWYTKQIDADGFRIDAVKHFPTYVTEDLLRSAMGEGIEYFCVGEHVSGADQIDRWASETGNRCGTFDVSLRNALADIVDAGGRFDMGSLPNFQQANRIKTVPFLNSHDTWKGAFWDSEPGSSAHDDRSGDWRRNDDEILPTIDPDNPRADVAHAAAFAVNGSPLVYYEDLFVNSGPERLSADPGAIPARGYLTNLLWAHRNLNLKDGAYLVRFRESPDLLVIERSGQALIGLNDHGSQALNAQVQTNFGPGVALHDYSGSNDQDLTTGQDGSVTVSVPPMSYAIWARAGITGGPPPAARRTTQEFQLDDDLGDSSPDSLRYGGKVCPADFRTAGAVWVAAGTPVSVALYTDGERDAELRVLKPNGTGAKAGDQGQFTAEGQSAGAMPLTLDFASDREGYHQLTARLAGGDQDCTRGYLKVEYQAPATSDKF